MSSMPSLLSWSQDPYTAIVSVLTLTLISWLLLKLIRVCKRPHSHSLHTKDPLKAHIWEETRFLHKPTYCTVCEEVCISGRQCQCCGICVCTLSACIRKARSVLRCKPLCLSTSLQHTPHFFVRGNLPLSSTCQKCQETCGSLPYLSDYLCVWCGQSFHEECLAEKDESVGCSLGPHRNSILAPHNVQLDMKGWKGRKRLVIKGLSPPSIGSHWRPLIVLANPKSGGKDGEMILHSFRRLLNPLQVLDLSQNSPEAGLEICRLLPDCHCRVLVCGGDGTVGWVLSAMDKCTLKNIPYMAVLPLGTGNDLARTIGWGSGYENEDLSDIIQDVYHSQVSLLDRWRVSVKQTRYLGLEHHNKHFVMNNYIGFGCGAGVALDFHNRRENNPSLFNSRIINKVWYLGLGAKDVLQQSCKNLHEKIEVVLDGVKHCLPHLEGLVVANINSWSAGCRVWSLPYDQTEGQYQPCRMDDKLLEVVGIYSSLHVGRIQIGVDEPLKIGQATNIKIVIHSSVPVQVDGEPWQQGCPATITISHLGQSHMLRKVKQE